MSEIDWLIAIGTTLAIVLYGIWKTRGAQNIRTYLLSDNDVNGWTIGLSIMATQASAITFLSTPGQAYNDGMRFVQFYFGLPLAMVIISAVIIPIYHNLRVYTAYEYLEKRFNLKTRLMGAVLFLLSRSIAAGLTIYAPAVIFAAILDWDTRLTCVLVGILVTLYTVTGGTRAVNVTQKQQMLIILFGMFAAAFIMVGSFPPDISFGDALHIAGKMGKLNTITSPASWAEFDPKDRYNIWAGLIGGTFLSLSYFGTDQSQVQRYLGGSSIAESRYGVLFNAIFKIPMQFLILLVGVMMFVYYQFQAPPLFFNSHEVQLIQESSYSGDFQSLADSLNKVYAQKQVKYRELLGHIEEKRNVETQNVQGELIELENKAKGIKQTAKDLIKKNRPQADVNDLDQVFLHFVIHKLPRGIVGLLIAVILAAAMSSASAELNSLATTGLIDVYKRLFVAAADDAHYLRASKLLTLFWGVFAIGFSLFANKLGNMIQAVNIVGSLFYGTILGIFITGFFIRSVKGNAVFWAAVSAEILVVTLWILPQLPNPAFKVLDIGYLWYNLIGCVLVIGISLGIQALFKPQANVS